MTEVRSVEDGFLADINANPDNIANYRILGDYLQDRDDPRGEFIIVQCNLAELPTDAHASDRVALRNREAELLAKHGAKWRGPLIDAEFQYGLIKNPTILLNLLANFNQPLPPLIAGITLNLNGQEVSPDLINSPRIRELIASPGLNITVIPGNHTHYEENLASFTTLLGENRTITAKLDDISIRIVCPSEPYDIHADFQKEAKRLNEEYLNRPEVKEAALLRQAKLNAAETRLPQLMEEFPEVLAAKGPELLRWMDEYIEAARITGNTANNEKIVIQLRDACNPTDLSEKGLDRTTMMVKQAVWKFIRMSEQLSEQSPWLLDGMMYTKFMDQYNLLVAEGVVPPPNPEVQAKGLQTEKGEDRGTGEGQGPERK